MKAYPPGAIALPCSDLARYHAFTMAIISVEYPPGTRVHMVNSLSVAANLNIVCRDLPDEAEWLALQSDDHVFAPDSLLKMLARMYDEDLDVLVPIMCRRHPPFSPLIFKEETDDGRYMAYAWDEIPAEGLLGPLHAAGTGGMLVRRRVLEQLAEAGLAPDGRYFENTAGEVINEDTEFCRKLRRIGVEMWADCSVAMGHCGMFIAWPQREAGHWGIRFQMGEGPEGALKGIFLQPGERPADA